MKKFFGFCFLVALLAFSNSVVIFCDDILDLSASNQAGGKESLLPDKEILVGAGSQEAGKGLHSHGSQELGNLVKMFGAIILSSGEKDEKQDQDKAQAVDKLMKEVELPAELTEKAIQTIIAPWLPIIRVAIRVAEHEAKQYENICNQYPQNGSNIFLAVSRLQVVLGGQKVLEKVIEELRDIPAIQENEQLLKQIVKVLFEDDKIRLVERLAHELAQGKALAQAGELV